MSKKSKGLGDSIAKFTEATGIKKVVKFIAGDDCGCDERQELLNKLFPYGDNPECLTEIEYNYLKDYFRKYPDNNSGTRSKDILKVLYAINNRVYKQNKKPSSCASCVRAVLHQLKLVYKAYEI